jgi:phage shock protein PspC (stress-responsive transcriptional regulator)
MEAQENQVALPLRSHTILGVCEAIGEDFGLNPTFLRIPFAASVLYSPTWAVIAYFALGAVVLASRLLFPKAKTEAKPAVEARREATIKVAEDVPQLAKAA